LKDRNVPEYEWSARMSLATAAWTRADYIARDAEIKRILNENDA